MVVHETTGPDRLEDPAIHEVEDEAREEERVSKVEETHGVSGRWEYEVSS